MILAADINSSRVAPHRDGHNRLPADESVRIPPAWVEDPPDGLVDVFASYKMTVTTQVRWHPDPAQDKDIAAARQLWFVVNSIVSGMDRPSESPTGEERPIRSRKWRICSSSAPGASRTIV